MPEPGLHLVHEPAPEARKALFDLLPGPTDGRMAFARIVRWHRREGFEHGRQASRFVKPVKECAAPMPSSVKRTRPGAGASAIASTSLELRSLELGSPPTDRCWPAPFGWDRNGWDTTTGPQLVVNEQVAFGQMSFEVTGFLTVHRPSGRNGLRIEQPLNLVNRLPRRSSLPSNP
jgi:hypothetical protein